MSKADYNASVGSGLSRIGVISGELLDKIFVPNDPHRNENTGLILERDTHARRTAANHSMLGLFDYVKNDEISFTAIDV
ncbi:MAG: hypothetical protein EBS06_04545 [Proteobacteria bacterium]|nr:hypothetical protein [Pseudomonadota bacterium]